MLSSLFGRSALTWLGVFAVQHTVMARPAFKRWWTRCVPEPIERSTFVLITCVILVLLFWQWRSFPGVIWRLEGRLRSPFRSSSSPASASFCSLPS